MLKRLKISTFVLFLLSGLAGLAASQAHAMPLGSGWPALDLTPTIASDLKGAVDFTAIVALNNCSGSLIRFETSLGNEQALVLTNGHCLSSGFMAPGEAKQNESSSRTFRMLSADGRGSLGELTADRLVYATMTGTDMAIYRVTESYDSIEKQYGVHALTVSSKHPEATRHIAVVSGYWRKIYSCAIDRFAYELHEAGWIWKDSIRFLQPGCETIGGTSGSPIVDADTHEVVGINNTGNDAGEKCTEDNPCEVDAQGNITFEKGASYGQQTFWMYDCLTSGVIDATKPGCKLTKPAIR